MAGTGRENAGVGRGFPVGRWFGSGWGREAEFKAHARSIAAIFRPCLFIPLPEIRLPCIPLLPRTALLNVDRAAMSWRAFCVSPPSASLQVTCVVRVV
jgi:hypothetical protein